MSGNPRGVAVGPPSARVHGPPAGPGLQHAPPNAAGHVGRPRRDGHHKTGPPEKGKTLSYSLTLFMDQILIFVVFRDIT